MIYRAFKMISSEIRGLHRAAFILAASSLLSSLLALARDRLLAHMFGAGATLDLYYAAFRLPDLIFVGTGALVSVYILIPELARRTDDARKTYLDTIIAGFSLFSIAVSVVAGVLAPYFLRILFPNIADAGRLPDLVLLSRMLLVQPILLGLSNILAAVTQSQHRYTLYSLSPLLYNLGIIMGIGVLYPLIGLTGLAWGVIIGAIVHAGVQVPSIVQDGYLRRLPRVYDVQALLHTAFVSMPRALALSMSEIAELGLVTLAGTLSSGSIAIFMFAYNLQAVPLGIIGASYSVAAFPTLARALSSGERETFLRHVAQAARYVFFWSMPATALILPLRAFSVRFILGTGRFNWTDTRLVAAVFALLGLSLAAQGITLLLIRGYYAAGRTFVPFMISCATAILTILLGYGFTVFFTNDALLRYAEIIMRVQDVPGTKVLALGLAYSLAAIAGAIALVAHFEHRHPGFIALIRRSFFESIFSGVVAMACTYGMLVVVGPLEVGSTTLTVFLKGFAAGAVGLIVALITYWVLGSRELQETYDALHSRLFKREPEPAVTLAGSAEDQIGQS